MAKIGIIIQRYGLEVNGGAEYHARILAEKLSKKHTIDIITTCALNSDSWKNHYKITDNVINDVNIIRFGSKTKSPKIFRKTRRKILGNSKPQQILKKLGIHNILKETTRLFTLKEKDSYNWLKEQGPYCPELINYLEEEQDNYDCFIFFTYLYYPTAVGMKKVGDKSIFIPTAHDEPLLYTAPYKNLFAIPKYIMYNTASEKKLVENAFSNYSTSNDIAGVGISVNSMASNNSKYDYEFDYLLYIGRVDGAKGCNELIKLYHESNFTKSLKLIFVGKKAIDQPETENIIFTGFVSDEVKYQLLNNCKALIIPSKYESLSLVTLEAMLHKKIVIANANCEVLQDHIRASKAGFSYTDQKTFNSTIDKLLKLSENEILDLGEKGHKYVSDHYTWKKILEKFDKAIDFVVNSNP